MSRSFNRPVVQKVRPEINVPVGEHQIIKILMNDTYVLQFSSYNIVKGEE